MNPTAVLLSPQAHAALAAVLPHGHPIRLQHVINLAVAQWWAEGWGGN
jgi:hypothetical protein